MRAFLFLLLDRLCRRGDQARTEWANLTHQPRPSVCKVCKRADCDKEVTTS